MNNTTTHTHTRITWVQEKWITEDLRPIGCDYSVFYSYSNNGNKVISLFFDDPANFTYEIVCDGNIMATLWSGNHEDSDSYKVGTIKESLDLFRFGITNDEEYDVAVSTGRLVVVRYPTFSFVDTSTNVITYSDIMSLSEAVNLGFRFVTKYLPK